MPIKWPKKKATAQDEWHLLKLQINYCSSTLNSSVSGETIKVHIQKIQNWGKKSHLTQSRDLLWF